MRIGKFFLLALSAVSIFVGGPASASLTTFQTFIGKVGVSADGFGSTSQSGVISADVPAGSTVLAAYLYTSTYFTVGGEGGTLDGSVIPYGPDVPHDSGFLSTRRADVTTIIKPTIDGGSGGIYNFAITETSDNQNGEALVVVYSNPALADATFGLVDGFSSFAGDSTTINFADPLDPSDPGFFAEMFLGIGHSCCTQANTISVNGIVITENAGNQDDGVNTDNGSLITVGGFDDPFSSLLPSYENDHERYNLVPYITAGDTSILVETVNPSNNDNIFLAGFYVSGAASINEPPVDVPEPSTLALFGLGLGALVMTGTRWRHFTLGTRV